MSWNCEYEGNGDVTEVRLFLTSGARGLMDSCVLICWKFSWCCDPDCAAVSPSAALNVRKGMFPVHARSFRSSRSGREQSFISSDVAAQLRTAPLLGKFSRVALQKGCKEGRLKHFLDRSVTVLPCVPALILFRSCLFRPP